ncbi:MAG: helix-turn-helix domain-containing protein [Planctomycetaceae bacterium]|nr:helix-turn-helix domain-containing protein [Planctomycetaceae bacterium]
MQKVYLFGKWTAAERKAAAETVRQNGDKVAARLSGGVNLVVIGDLQLLEDDWNTWNDELDAATKDGFESGTLQVITEPAFWEIYTGETIPQQFYTLSELARMTHLPLSTVRLLERKNIIAALPTGQQLLFDRESVLTLKIAAVMLTAGLSFNITEDRLHRLRHLQKKLPLPRRLNSVSLDGKTLLLDVPNGIMEHTGQYRLMFGAENE